MKTSADSPRTIRLFAAAIVAAGVLAWANTLDAPFIFDDAPSIEHNESIRRLWPPARVLSPPSEGGPGVSGRPVVNLSLAINYALGKLDVRGYHATNLALHVLAGLVLFGVVRGALAGPVLGERHRGRAAAFGFSAALLWTLHPLQTESVTCIIQRTEVLVGLFYLLTLHCLARSATAGDRSAARWQLAGIGACLLGMGSKEVMVTAPVVAFLFDRTFLAGSFAEAWRRRWRFHCGLAATWGLLGVLVAGNATRGGSAGFGGAMGPWEYLLTQCRAVVLYLRLSFWPHPLVLDYGRGSAGRLAEVWPQALLLLALLAATLCALRRRPAAGFCGAAFFLILAPSSSVVPLITQTIAEHRMYLPLAAVIALALSPLLQAGRAALPAVVPPVALALLAATIARNRQYSDPEALWLDNAAHAPGNARAYTNLAGLKEHEGDFAAAAEYARRALAVDPADPVARFKLPFNLSRLGRHDEAIAWFERAVVEEPASGDLRMNFGSALLEAGRFADAIAQLRRALELGRRDAEVHFNLGRAQLRLGNVPDALASFETSLRLNPAAPESHSQYAAALVRAGRLEEAVSAYRTAVRLRPDYTDAWINLGSALFLLQRIDESIAAYEEALRHSPGDVRARERLDFVRRHPRPGGS